MPFPVIAAALAGAVLRAAVKKGAQVAVSQAARRAAARAAQRVANRSLQRARDILRRDATRRQNCRTCRQLDELASPCALLSRGTGLNNSPYAGGSHAGNRSRIRPGVESHHIPAQDAYPIGVRRGVGWMPAIQMDAADHRQTASYGSGNAAKKYRRTQQGLLRRGRLREAFLMDVVDIKSKFGDKYDGAIAEAAAYTECIQQYKKKYGL